MPILETYYINHKEDGFTLIGINSGDNQDQVEEFVSQYQLTFPMWLDPTGKAIYAFRNNALPSSYIIDRSGMVRLVWVGSVTIDALETYLTPILSE